VIVFSAIAPIILVIGTLAFSLLWFAHRYSCVYVNRPESENRGRLYPAALFQLFTGLYVLQLCLIGLFTLGQDAHGGRGCLPQAVMMCFALMCTAVYHRKLVVVYSPLFSRTAMDGTGADQAGLLNKEIYSPTVDGKKDISQGHSASSSTSPHRIRQPVLTERRPVVWIPQDRLGVSDYVINETREIHGMRIPISNENAILDNKGRVVCQSCEPPLQDS
jgi:calcium permeable stress-gated cation channel